MDTSHLHCLRSSPLPCTDTLIHYALLYSIVIWAISLAEITLIVFHRCAVASLLLIRSGDFLHSTSLSIDETIHTSHLHLLAYIRLVVCIWTSRNPLANQNPSIDCAPSPLIMTRRTQPRRAGGSRGGHGDPDTNYTAPSAPRGGTPPNAPHRSRRGDQVTNRTIDVGEHIDITLSDENSSQEDDPPPAPSNVAIPAASNAANTSVAQPASAPAPAPSSRGVAHDINYFFRRGVKNQQSSTVCKMCE